MGQEHVAQTLTNAIRSGRISQGYLFSGTRGVGKTSAARILTQALNCEEGLNPEPCGKCGSCRAILAGVAMDVLEIDGASNRGVEDIRELREQVKYASLEGGYKVYIIDEVHMLTKEAFNALLKTLEEPPAKVVFIFATTEVRKLPSTILSRVQRFDFKRISPLKIVERLSAVCEAEGITADAKALHLVAERADGSMRDALSLLDQVYAFSREEISEDSVRKILGMPPGAFYDSLLQAVREQQTDRCLSLVDAAYQDGIDPLEFLNGFARYLRDVLFALQPGLDPEILGMGSERREALVKNAQDLEEGDVLRYAGVISEMLDSARRSSNVRLVLDLGFARLSCLDRVVRLSQLLRATDDTGSLKKKIPAIPA